MGGLALDKLGYFSDKLVYVKLRPNSEFVTISGISRVMKYYPNLQSRFNLLNVFSRCTPSVVLTTSTHFLECHTMLL